MIVSTRTARLTPLSIVRAGCRRILVDDSHDTLVWGFALGTPIAGRPPHRSGRARFEHPAPTSGV